MTASEVRTLRSGFLRSLALHPDRPAVDLAGEALSYGELAARARSIAVTLDDAAPADELPLTAVFGHRSFAAVAGVLGALFRGHGYVPLNPSFPVERTRAMLARSGCSAVVVDASAVESLQAAIAGLDRRLVLLLPEHDDVAPIAMRFPEHHVLGRRDLLPGERWTPRPVDPNGIAYLLFTSGSTGQPKGVMVAHRNVTFFLDQVAERYGVTEHDRLSQTFDLTFDLSVFDLFLAWERGACVCLMTAAQKMLPSKYVQQQRITLWFSVPSTAVLMSRLRMLKPGQYPSLRYALFCGEGLPLEVVQAFASAAPNAVVENLYGPTELTIACTVYRYHPETSPAECELGLLPIGEPFPGLRPLVVDDTLHEVAEGEAGELLVSGPQVTLGYYRDEARTAKAFVVPPGRTDVHYRTGDRVRRAAGRPMTYLGRVDHQIKVQGYRVELGEIEAVLREEAGVEVAIAVGFPTSPSTGAEGVVAFLQTHSCDVPHVLARASERLPSYMAPREIRLVPTMPLNANGKIDRGALLGSLTSEPV